MINGQSAEPLKIAIALASRGRPAAMCGVIMTAWRLQSATNHLAFTVAVDDDDVDSIQMLDLMKRDGEVPVTPVIAPRSYYLGGAQNRAIKAAEGSDLVTLLSDRTFVITPGWDIGVAEAAMKYPNRVLWWSCPSDPDTTTPIIPHTLLDRMDWVWSPEIFGYWYDDTWWMEIDRMIFGGPSLRVRPMFSGARGQTTRGRDFEFWTRAFIVLRPRRMAEAKRLAEALGLPWKDPPPEMLDDFYARDRHLLAHADEFQRVFGDPRPPDEGYLLAKARAEKLMEEMA